MEREGGPASNSSERAARAQGGGPLPSSILAHSTSLLGKRLLEHGERLALLAVVSHNGAAAPHDLAGGALLVDLAQAAPLPELLVLGHGDERHVVLGAEGLDELLVVGLGAVTGEDAELRLALLDGPAGLVEAAAEAIVGESLLENGLEGVVEGKGLLGGGGSDGGSGGLGAAEGKGGGGFGWGARTRRPAREGI